MTPSERDGSNTATSMDPLGRKIKAYKNLDISDNKYLFYRGSGAGFNEVNFIGNYHSGLPFGVVWTKMTGGYAFNEVRRSVLGSSCLRKYA